LSKRNGSKFLGNWLRRVIELDAQESKIIELALIDGTADYLKLSGHEPDG
jgi:hypothetical protein